MSSNKGKEKPNRLFSRQANTLEEESPEIPTCRGISGRLAFHSDTPDTTPRKGSPTPETDGDFRALNAVLDRHHQAMIQSVRTTLEININHMFGRLQELIEEVCALRRDLEAMKSRFGYGNTNNQVDQLREQLEKERQLRLKQEKDHEEELTHLYRQLSAVL